MIYQSWYQSDHLAEVVFVSFLRSKVIIIIIIILSFLYTHFHIIFCRRKLLCVFHTYEWEAMLINLRVECLHNFFEILLHGRFLFLLGLFVCFFLKMSFIYLKERGEKNQEREGQMEREKQVPCKQGACLGNWIMI